MNIQYYSNKLYYQKLENKHEII